MKYLLSSTLIAFSFLSVAQNTEPTTPAGSKWKRELLTGIFFNQSSFSNNWKGGGTNTVAWNALLNGRANYTDGKFQWTNDLQLQYGQVNSKGIGLRKNFDRIFFESKISYQLVGPWRAFGSVNFMSQFADGYDYKKNTAGEDSVTYISAFLSPGYLTEAVGIEYKPVQYFSAELGLGALRQTFVTNQDIYTNGATVMYGVNKGANYRNQVVFQFILNFDKEIMKNVSLKARYLGIVDYAKISGQGIVHRLDVNLIAKVNKYITVNFGTVVLYDFDQDKDVQYSQVLGLGVAYRFTEFETTSK